MTLISPPRIPILQVNTKLARQLIQAIRQESAFLLEVHLELKAHRAAIPAVDEDQKDNQRSRSNQQNDDQSWAERAAVGVAEINAL